MLARRPARPAAAPKIHEFLEFRIQIVAMTGPLPRAEDAPWDRVIPTPPCGRRATEGDWLMQWQTPTAIDFRFGFEITLYVAAR